MGTSSSLIHPHDEDDVLGDFDGSNGVIKRIPIEVKPRGRLGLRSVGSLGNKKPKGGSLRSALSVDLENPEVERIKREFEMYRLQKESEMANLEKREKKFDIENKRMRSELQALQKTCAKLRVEKDAALEAEQQALARSATFEKERDKVQRQFKIFRETKESEIQNLLRTRRDLENKLQKNSVGLDDSETSSKIGDHLIGTSHGDWWTALDSEPSIGSTTQLHVPFFRGPEFALSHMEVEGPFTNVTKEDWMFASACLSQSQLSAVNDIVRSMIRLYISCPLNDHHIFKLLNQECKKLKRLCLLEGRDLVTVYMPFDASLYHSVQVIERLSASKARQIQQANIVVAYLDSTLDRYTEMEYRLGHLDNPGNKHAIFALSTSGSDEVGLLKNKIYETGNCKIIDDCQTADEFVSSVSDELEKMIKLELGIDPSKEISSDDESGFFDNDSTERLCSGNIWDANSENEQKESFMLALQSSCELGFEKYYETLNSHFSSAGPLPPLLVLGPAGSGRSLLLAKWTLLQQQKDSGSLILYHFVSDSASGTADAVAMIRRLMAQLMKQVVGPPALTNDPERIIEEFPRWLEKISSKTSGGILIVLDSPDRCQQSEKYLKWLLDPLPVDARVIVSASDEFCPQAWRSWPTIHMEPLSTKSIRELIRTEVSSYGLNFTSDQESQVLTHCRTPATCNPLYVMVLTSLICRCNNDEIDERLISLLSTSDCVMLYKTVIEAISQLHENSQTMGIVKKILQFIYVSRNGLSEEELMSLIPGVDWNFLAPLIDSLSDHLVLVYQSGLLVLAHSQVRQAIRDKYFPGPVNKQIDTLRHFLIEYFQKFLRPGEVTCRVADELPWHFKQLGDKEKLHDCLLVLCIFQRLYARGRCGELLNYWRYINVEKTVMADEYFNCVKNVEARVAEFNGALTLPKIADLCETLGRFLRDIGLLSQASAPLQHALELRETALDPDHPIIGQSLHHLAGLHAQWGKFNTAEQLYRQALEIYESSLGPDHFCVAKELDALAILYQKQEKHDLSEPLHRKAVGIRKKLKQSKSHQVNSGAQLRSFSSSNGLNRRALQLEELAMGPESPELARTLNELGVLYYLQNDPHTAESFFKRSLEMREKLLGSEHPDIAQSLNNLAALYNDVKQYELAEPLYEKALAIRLQHFPAHHQNVATVVKHLSMLYKKQGKLSKAEPLYRRALEIREVAFGKSHPSVATALVNLAVLYCQQTKQDEALPLYERALSIFEETFGSNHPRIAETLKNLAVLHYDQGNFETAASLYKRATEIKDQGASNVILTDVPSNRRTSSEETDSTIKPLPQPPNTT